MNKDEGEYGGGGLGISQRWWEKYMIRWEIKESNQGQKSKASTIFKLLNYSFKR